MNRDEVLKAFAELGGMKRLVRWAKKREANLEKFYTMFHASLLQADDAPHVESREQELSDVIERSLFGAIDAIYRDNPPAAAVITSIDGGPTISDCRGPAVRKMDGANHGVPTHDLSHTPHGITDTAAHPKPQPQPSDGVTKPPKPDAAAHQLTPAEARARALGPPNPPLAAQGQLTSNDLFYNWTGHGRATWSADSNWRGY
jgi:hypothetical protein